MTGIEWTWLILTILSALLAVNGWHDYATADVPDGGMAAYLMAWLFGAGAFVFGIAWLIALAL